MHADLYVFIFLYYMLNSVMLYYTMYIGNYKSSCNAYKYNVIKIIVEISSFLIIRRQSVSPKTFDNFKINYLKELQQVLFGFYRLTSNIQLKFFSPDIDWKEFQNLPEKKINISNNQIYITFNTTYKQKSSIKSDTYENFSYYKQIHTRTTEMNFMKF